MDKEIVLRPHHSVCFNLFIGEGYSNDFVKNMKSILGLDDDTLIKISFGLDSVCKACPNKISNKCKTEVKVRYFDKEVAKVCNFNDGDIMPLNDFKQIAKEKVLNTDAFDKICNTCSYYDFCKEINKKRIENDN